jgi:hypothetical protein
MTTTELPTHTDDDLGFCIRLEHEFYNPLADDESFPSERFEIWYRWLWSALETGQHHRGHAWECGLGLEGAVAYAEHDARQMLAPVPDELEVVLGWLRTWAAERRGALH